MGLRLKPMPHTEEKIRKKIEEIEKASGNGLKSLAKNIIEQYALGDEIEKEEVSMEFLCYSSNLEGSIGGIDLLDSLLKG